MISDSACPRFSSFLFNDPKFDIPEQIGKVPANCDTIGSAPLPIDAGTTPAGTSRQLLSVAQGVQLKATIDSLATAMALSGNAPTQRGPCAPGGAVPWPNCDHITLFSQTQHNLLRPQPGEHRRGEGLGEAEVRAYQPTVDHHGPQQQGREKARLQRPLHGGRPR